MENRVIALGFFDGVHLGHAALLKKTVERAKEYGAKPAVLTFKSHPSRLTGRATAGLINSVEEREHLIREIFGIEDIILWEFDDALMHMPWKEFINRVAETLSAVHFVVGYDYRFGYKGEGDAEKLRKYASILNVGTDIEAPVEKDGMAVSSTLIRGFISAGEIEKANAFLGHPHCIISAVEQGAQLGRTLGLPTINQHFPDNALVPAYGVYASKVYIDGKAYMSVTNIGVRPTVTDERLPKAETHIIDYCGDLYGQKVRIELFKFIRSEKCFSDIDKLKEQIKSDVESTKKFFNR